ncbi:MAG: DNA cytosine methyltransferase, partial [Aestuariivirga sp.]
MGGLTYGSLCSGIEAATVAWHPLGWTPAFFSEIDKSASRLLAHHYPRVPNHGDMTKFKEWPDHAIQLLVGGTPCQSFSVAGLRKGLADPRGNLALTFLAVADHYRPAWVVWENVPGVFSSVSHDAPDPRPPPDNLDSGDGPADGQEVVVEDEYDADENTALGCFLAGLSELGYGCAWAIRDAQHVRVDGFGRAVPQRRRRVFVVGHLGDWRRAAAVLFERESLSGHSPPRREKGKGTAADVDPSLTSSGRGVERTGETRGQDPVIGVMCADVSMCLNAGGMGRIDSESESESESESFIAHALTSSGFDASENGTGRRTPLVPVAYRTTGNDGCYETGDIIHAL